MSILNASGNEIGKWDNQGVQLNAGSINLANNFVVTTSGAVTANNINAQGGQISGIIINDNYLRHGSHITASNWKSMCTPYGYDGDVYVGSGGFATSDLKTVSGTTYTRHLRIFGGNIEFRLGAYLSGGIGHNDTAVYDGFYIYDNDRDVIMRFSDAQTYIHNNLWQDGTFVDINGDLYVHGKKSRQVSTEDYADRLLYCYETPSPLFGDVGDGQIADDGYCYVQIDPVFLETITTNQYQVFLQKYGEGDCYVLDRKSSYFVVKGTPNLQFGWELKAKQFDSDQRRLEKIETEPTVKNSINYGEDAITHIREIAQEREVV